MASSRLRAYRPSAALAAAGWAAEILPEGGGEGSWDCVVFQKANNDADVEMAQRLKAAGTKVVFDLSDNHFYNPRNHPALAERAERDLRMIDLADAVTVSTAELGRVIEVDSLFCVDDALDVPRQGLWSRGTGRRRRQQRSAGSPLRLVWFGNTGRGEGNFGLSHFASVLPALERLRQADLPVELTVISNSRELFAKHIASASLPTHYHEWAPRSFARHFAANDVCVLPVELNPVTRCKSVNRPLLSFQLGLPVVASPIPSYAELGPWILFEDWERSITTYAQDPALALDHVDRARTYIRSTYTPEHLVEQWAAVFQRLLGRS